MIIRVPFDWLLNFSLITREYHALLKIATLSLTSYHDFMLNYMVAVIMKCGKHNEVCIAHVILISSIFQSVVLFA